MGARDSTARLEIHELRWVAGSGRHVDFAPVLRVSCLGKHRRRFSEQISHKMSQDVTRCHKSTFPGHGHNPPGSALKYDAPLGRPNRVRYGAEGELPASLTMLRSQCFLGFLKAKSRKSARHLWWSIGPLSGSANWHRTGNNRPKCWLWRIPYFSHPISLMSHLTKSTYKHLQTTKTDVGWR